MLVTKIKSNIYRLVFGSNESDIYYLCKSVRGTWSVRQSGEVLEFAPTKQLAIQLAQTIYGGK